MKQLLIILTIAILTFSMPGIAEDTRRAISIPVDQAADLIYAGKATRYREGLGDVRGATVHKSEDGKFALGWFELIITDETEREGRYESFPKNEYMYFVKGGMKFIDDEGGVAEAGPGEMLFVPQGWTGTRIITGKDAIHKFSIVYDESK